MFGVFGEIIFRVSTDRVQTFEGLSVSSQGRWSEHSSQEKPELEFAGDGTDSLKIKIKSSIFLKSNPTWISERLQEYKREGTAQYFVLGGKPFRNKKWIVKSFDENWKQVDNRGRPLVVEFSLSLSEYGEAWKWYKEPLSLINYKNIKKGVSYLKNIDFDTGEMS